MIAGSIVDWGALAKVVVFALVAGVGLPVVYAVAVLGADRSSQARRGGAPAAGVLYAALAVVCGAICLAAIAAGVYLMTRK